MSMVWSECWFSPRYPLTSVFSTQIVSCPHSTVVCIQYPSVATDQSSHLWEQTTDDSNQCRDTEWGERAVCCQLLRQHHTSMYHQHICHMWYQPYQLPILCCRLNLAEDRGQVPWRISPWPSLCYRSERWDDTPRYCQWLQQSFSFS